MSDISMWKLAERMEQMMDQMESIEDYLDSIYDHHVAYNNWIQVATESLTSLQEQVNFLKNKKTCV